jgi:hypothetical protein
MKRFDLRLVAVVLLTIPACGGSSDTVEFCDDACRIWNECTGWDTGQCLSECRAEKDWDATYLACLRS